ncbi:MAG TPA: MarR family winged helix-turn-helix transcriptional regulator [Spirochaetota bacterium]|nr:MarR family winged helix-turn-helix transcriptional regulator [Spirochaetota bacterium]
MIPEDFIFYKISRAAQKANKFWSRKIQHLSITPVQGLILLFLHDQDQVTFSELSKRTGLDSATLTGIVDRLERANLILRMQKPGDRRAFLICLTVEGGTVAGIINTTAEISSSEFLADFSKKDISDLNQLLDKIGS